MFTYRTERSKKWLAFLLSFLALLFPLLARGTTIWNPSETPSRPEVNDGVPIEVGTKFQTDGAGAGDLLSTVTFTGETDKDAADNVSADMSAAVTPTLTESASSSIWSNSPTPALIADPETGAGEVGVKFRSDIDGYITGIRFYKAPTNTGTHIGSLWTGSGTRLAGATFTNETASGWQQVAFATPVPITANTVYVASYHLNVGHYSADANYFTAGVDNPPLHALADGVSGANGLAAAGSTSTFPSEGWNKTNYWVDVVFSPTTTGDTTPPTVTSFTIPATASSLTVPITAFTVTDNLGVTGYLVNESFSAPTPSADGWSATAQTSYTFATDGSKALYAWAKDAAGNVSASVSATVAVSVTDTIAPTVTSFNVPATSDSLTVPITAFTATDDVGSTGYLVTESAVAPPPSDPGWAATAPTSYSFTTAGSKTLYAWAKDAAGNISPSLSATVRVATDGWTCGFPGGHKEALGPFFEACPHARQPPVRREAPNGVDSLSRLRYWNEIALNANALDHTPVEPDEVRVFGEQIGPHRTSRAFAIVHIAIFDAVNAIAGGYRGYTRIGRVHAPTSMCAAIAQAAHDTLVSLFPSQAERFDTLLEEDLERIPTGPEKDNGIALGKRSAGAILGLRANDGSQHAEPVIGVDFFTSDNPGKWRQDPISMIPLALGAYWDKVKPFVLRSAGQYYVQNPPSLTSVEYAKAFKEVKRLGGDGIVTPTERTEEQTIAGIYWGYDGTPGLGTPPRLYNQIAVQIAEQKGSDVVETARLLALLNVGMADAAIACWKYKYDYQFWRPITGIREADPGSGPTGLGDGNPATIGDPTFSPLGAPASNLIGPNFTPPFPAYASGHASFGGVLFQMLRKFYRTDAIAFTFVSDEFNGVTTDNTGMVRPLIPRTFSSLSEAEEENGQSRIYLGIHWKFDKTKGIAHGNQVADYVMKYAFRPYCDQ